MLDDAAIASFLDLSFDHLCTRKVKELVDLDRVIRSIDAALEPERIADVQQRVVKPARQRLIARARASSLKVEVWLPAPVKDLIAEELAKPAPLPPKLVDELVGSEKVRDEVRAMLSDTLSSFIKKATGGSGEERDSSPGAAAARAFGFGARAMAAAGRGLLGGLGDQLERTLQDKVRDFVDASVAVVQQRIAKKLTSEETAKGLGKRRKEAFLGFMAKTESEVADYVAKAPHDVIDAVVPGLVQHNLKRPELREAIRAEIEAAIAELGGDEVGAVLDRLGQRALAREAMHAHVGPIAKDFVATPGFTAWFAAVKP
jgi:hypothetical protein